MTKKQEDKQLFRRAAIFTDIHWGLKNNSIQHNQDCTDFIDWFIEQAKSSGADTCLFLGDWHHNRHTINVSTLNKSNEAIHKLSENFDQCYIIIGNHDLFYRERRDVHSLPHFHKHKNVVMIEDITQIGDCLFCPWLVNEEYKQLKNYNTKYCFGHFEFPNFRMNSFVRMPDNGKINLGHVNHFDLVLTGHFHSRQERHNTIYVGNPFGHNYNDIWDFERGMCLLDWGDTKPTYINWNDGPRYIKVPLSEMLEQAQEHLNEKTYLKVEVDMNISYEESYQFREVLTEQYNVRELKMVPKDETETLTEASTTTEPIESIDALVEQSLLNIETDSYVPQKLVDIYKTI